MMLQERISFQPHPKTLTMAGELEYWAAEVCMQFGYKDSEVLFLSWTSAANLTSSTSMRLQ